MWQSDPQSDSQAVVDVLDLDGDGNLNIIVSNDAGIWSYDANETGPAAEPRFLIPSVRTQFLDMDQDGDLDIYTRYSNRRRAWFAQSPNGTFSQTPYHTLDNRQFADLDGDGDLDGIALLDHGGSVQGRFVWHETTGDELGVGPQHQLQINIKPRDSTDGARAPTTWTVDIDADGDQDIVAMPNHLGDIEWYENLDGRGSFGPANIIAPTGIPRPAIADFDADGDLDLIVASGDIGLTRLSWHRNDTDSWGSQRILAKNDPDKFLRDLHAADVDQDGLLDLWAVGDNRDLLWYRQLPDSEDIAFEAMPTVYSIDNGTLSLLAATDLDGDTYVGLVLRENDRDSTSIKRIQAAPGPLKPGDVNGDGAVSFADFLVVHAFFGSDDATRAQGDLDEDGRVAFSDFLILSAAYQTPQPENR